MRIRFLILSIASLLVFSACENDIDLTGEYIEAPVVLGLLNYNSDTQFVRISKTFLEKGGNAIELAKDPQQFLYDTLTAYLVEKSTNEHDTLKTILVNKEEGVFNSDKNVLYYSIKPIRIGESYDLIIETPTGLVAKGSTKTIDTVAINRPELQTRVQDISLKNFNDLFVEYNFRVSYPAEVAQFQIKMFLMFTEVTSEGRVKKEIEIPVKEVNNQELQQGIQEDVIYQGEQFYRTIARQLPKDGIRREVALQKSIRIEIYAADKDYRFYSNINGPISGLNQVRPEYSNVENGIGVFASRTYSVGYTQLNQISRNELFHGEYTSGRGFVDP